MINQTTKEIEMKNETISINGVDYVRADSVQPAPTGIRAVGSLKMLNLAETT